MAASEKDVLLKISQTTSGISNLEQLLKTSVKMSAQAMGVDRCAVWLTDKERKIAELKAVYVKGRTRQLPLGFRIGLNRFPKFKRIITQRRIVHSPDVSRRIANRFEREIFAKIKIKSSLSVPLQMRNKVLGVINFGTIKNYKSFTSSEKSLALIIANRIAVYIENARLYEELSDRAVQLQEQSIKVLRESEEKYRTLLENLPQLIFLKNVRSVYISVNKNFCKSMGVKPEQILGKTDLDFFPKELAQKYRRDDREIIRTGKTKTIIEDYIERGKRRIVQTVKTPVLGDDGKPIGVLGIFWDITESKRIENKLIQNEQIARERARFLSDLRNIDEFDDILTRVCQAVHDSFLFRRAVMTLNKPGGEIMHLGQVGLPNAEIKRARKAPPLDPKLRARITNKRFRISDSFFVPVEASLNYSKTSRYIPQKRKGPISGDWQIGDELFIPLRDFSGKTMGYLSVDTPFDGCRPERDKIEALEMLVEAAASRIREVQAQKAVKREADFSQSIIETANSLIICLDHEARITAFNKECERITGYRSQEVLGKKWPEIFLPPEYRHKNLKSFDSWVRTHPRDQYEGPIKTKKGEIRTILWSNTAIFGSREKDLIAIAIGQDITDRKMAEGALRESEEKWRSLVKNAPNIIMIVNRDGTIQFINRTVSSLTIEETVGKSIYDYIEPEYHKVVRETIKRVFRTGESGSYQIKGTGPDNSIAWYETYVGPILNNGQVIAATQIITDITERKKAEEAVLESEEKFRILAENSPNMIFINKKGKVVYANKRCEEVMGYRREEFYSPDFDYLSIVVSEYVDLVKEKFRKHMEDENVPPYEYAILSKKGKRIEAIVSTKLITYEGENAILGIVTDITERKKVEDELRESEHRYYSLFEDSPISLWEEDFSQVKRYIDKLKKRGIKDFETYLVNHPDAVEKCAEMVKVLDVNKATLNLFKAKTKKELKQKLSKTFIKESYNAFREELVSIAQGKTLFETEAITRTLKGEKNNILIRWTVAPGCEQTFSKVLVSIVDITEHKKADKALRESEEKIKNIFTSIGDAVTVTDLKGKVIECNQATLDLHGFSSKEDVFGRSSFDFVAPKDHTRARRNLEKTLEQGLVKDVEYTLLTKDKRQFPGELSASVVKSSSGEPVAFVAITKDISERKAAEEALRKSRDLNTILQISYKITQIHDLEKMLNLACQETAKALQVERCSISLVDQEKQKGQVNAIYVENKPDPATLGREFSLVDFPRVLRLYQRGERYAHCAPDIEKARLSEREKEYFRKEGVKSFVVVPIDTGKRLLGILLVGSIKKQRIFAESEITFVQTLASHLAVAIQNVRLMNLVKEQAENVEILSQRVITAQEEERKRTAQQLHDEISQDLALMKINTEITRKTVPAELDQVIQRIKDNENLTIQTLNKVRDLTSYLRPPLLDDLGLIDTLRWYIKDFSKRTNIKVALTSEKYRSRLHQDLEMVLYRIAQEALANVAKHAQASKVSISLEKKNNLVSLAVKDDGIGFDVRKMQREQKMKKGFGLFSMEERVKLLNGSFKLTSKLKKGTSLEVSLPCPKGRRYEKN